MLSQIAETITRKLSLPRVIGYISIGIIFGPFVLGSLPIGNLFPEGIFPRAIITHSENFSMLSSMAIIAATILLFHSGLETDMSLFLRYLLRGSVIGIGELTISFVAGYGISLIFFPTLGALHPTHLFIGAIGSATSVGISTSILSSKKKISSPEGVVILSAAVLDDVLSVVVLAIVTGVAELTKQNSQSAITISQIALIGGKALGIWLGCTAIGIVSARRFGKGLKRIIKNTVQLSVFCLGIAFLVGGIFEFSGISMIIGSYIVGLTLSNTDLSYVIQEKLTPIITLFIPIFFIVSGMNIDILQIFSREIFFLGIIYSLACVISKFVGAGICAFSVGFNTLGSARIGAGMIPRGEVSIIIANIALGIGFLTQDVYSAIMMMIFITSFTAPMLLHSLFKTEKIGTRRTKASSEVKTEITIENGKLARFIVSDSLALIEEEGFFISKISQRDRDIYHIRKDTMFITLHVFREGKLILFSDKESIPFLKTAFYEASTDIAESAHSIKQTVVSMQAATEELPHAATSPSEKAGVQKIDLKPFMSPYLVRMPIVSNTKNEIITELTSLLVKGGYISNVELFLKDIFERERTLSTGLQNGIAIPHVRSEASTEPKIVIGIKPDGVAFNSLDGKPSTIIILISSPKNYPHVSILAAISSFLNLEEFRKKLLSCEKEIDIIKLFT